MGLQGFVVSLIRNNVDIQRVFRSGARHPEPRVIILLPNLFILIFHAFFGVSFVCVVIRLSLHLLIKEFSQ